MLPRHALAVTMLFLPASACLAQQPAIKQTIRGTVVSVKEGDTLVVLVGQRQVTIRLEGIDAPEAGQPFYTQSKDALSELAFGQAANVYITGQDRNGRTLGIVTVGGRIVNRELVAHGFAWHDDQANNDRGLAAAQSAAQRVKAGLWADPTPTPPWEFRANKASGHAPARLDRDRRGSSPR